jgi:hypothetical protein
MINIRRRPLITEYIACRIGTERPYILPLRIADLGSMANLEPLDTLCRARFTRYVSRSHVAIRRHRRLNHDMTNPVIRLLARGFYQSDKLARSASRELPQPGWCDLRSGVNSALDSDQVRKSG